MSAALTDLLPCPFCGGPVVLERASDSHHQNFGTRKWWGVVCRNTLGLGGTCAIQQRPSASEAAAVERWNTRAIPAQPGIPAPVAGALDAERAAFEAKLRELGAMDFDLRTWIAVTESGETYRNDATQKNWLFWQARAQQAGAGQAGMLTADAIIKIAYEVGIIGPISDGNAVKFARAILAASAPPGYTPPVWCPECHARESTPDSASTAVPEGWKLVPLEPTAAIIAGAAIAVWPTAQPADIALARQAAPIVLMQMNLGSGVSVDTLAASLATMAPAYRAMLAAAPTAPGAEP